MHDHRFVFTPDHDAICEDVTCRYRYSKAEILRLLFEVANDDAVEQLRALDLPIVCDNCFTRRKSGDRCESCGSYNTANQ